MSKKLQLKHEDEDISANDSDIPDDEVHDRFIEGIKQSEGKPKISPATRNESAAEVSAFNLQSKKKSDKSKSSFRKDDLLRPLRNKQPKLAQKLEAVKKTTALSKPLETVYEKKIQREVGFEKAKKQLDRWNDVVQSNRVAEQLQFPLKSRKIEIYDHTDDDLFSSFSNPTPLEKELAAVLNSSDVAKEDKKKMEQSKYRITLKDILEKRKMIANVRAKASYAVSKARRQNKIKSKKYHRLLRSEKTKQQIKDFETLQKTDPEAALKQLEMLEKSRAQERATLRHRNTGKWARNQIIKAKYNKENRIALSEQLSKNRELTQKLKVKDSDDESGEDSDVPISIAPVKADSSNPWVPSGDDYGQFISNYKKYWEETTQETERPGDSGTEKKEEKPVQKGTVTEISEKKTSIPPSPTANMEKKNLQKLKKVERVSDVVGEVKKDESDNSEKFALVKEIMNSSGCWTVSELPAAQNDSNVMQSKKIKEKKKITESGVSNKVSEMFKLLEDKISKKLKRKINEMEETKDGNTAKNEILNEKEKVPKKKKKRSKSGTDTQQLLDRSLNFDSDINDTKKNVSTVKASLPGSSYVDIDANKFANSVMKRLATEIPDTITVGGEDVDDDQENDEAYRDVVEEAFATDDVVAGFEEEKAEAVNESQPKLIDSSLPGWGSWTDLKGLVEKKSPKVKRPRFNKRLLFKAPKVPPRKDANKGHVIITEEKSNKMKEHLVSDLPYPFTQVKDFEATLRAPIGRTWIPETAHQQLVAAPVVTKLGTVIEPIDEGELIDRGEL